MPLDRGICCKQHTTTILLMCKMQYFLTTLIIFVHIHKCSICQKQCFIYAKLTYTHR